jgi:hypothetical protein
MSRRKNNRSQERRLHFGDEVWTYRIGSGSVVIRDPWRSSAIVPFGALPGFGESLICLDPEMDPPVLREMVEPFMVRSYIWQRFRVLPAFGPELSYDAIKAAILAEAEPEPSHGQPIKLAPINRVRAKIQTKHKGQGAIRPAFAQARHRHLHR